MWTVSQGTMQAAITVQGISAVQETVLRTVHSAVQAAAVQDTAGMYQAVLGYAGQVLMDFKNRSRKFIILEKDALFVPGPKRGAIYDLGRRKLYHLDERLTKVFKSSQDGLSIQEAMLQAGIASEEEISLHLDILLRMDCISVSARPRPFHDIKIRKSPARPMVAWLEPTDRCNLFCVHCFAESRSGINEVELSTEKWLSIIDELDEIGVERVVFTGGEPLLRKDLFQLLEHACSKNSFQYIQILTNATLFAASPLLDLIAEKGIGVGLSFYSNKPEVHDKVTRTPGSWEKTVKGIKLLIDRGIKPAANIVLTRINEDGLDETRRFLVSLGLENDDIMSNVVLPTGRGCHSDYRVKNYDYLLRKAYTPEDCFGPGGWSDYLGTCWRGKFAIKANGKLIPCTMCREVEIGDVSIGRLSEIIESGAFDSIWDIDFDSTRTCSECELRYACTDCRALTYALTGDLYAKDPTCPYDPYTGDATEIFFSNTTGFPPLSLDSRPKRREGLSQAWIGKDLIVSDKRGNVHHRLNSVAGGIWDLLDGDHSLETIADLIGRRLERGHHFLEQDIIRVVEQLMRLGLVEYAS